MRRHPSAGVGRSWLLKAILRPRWNRSAIQKQLLCSVQRRDCVHGCPSPHCRGLCTGRPACPGASGRLHCVCGRGHAAECARLVAAEAGSARKDGKTALIPAAGLTRRRPVCGRTQRPLLEGRRHRGTGQPASLRRSRIQRGTAAAHRGVLEALPWQDAVSL